MKACAFGRVFAVSPAHQNFASSGIAANAQLAWLRRPIFGLLQYRPSVRAISRSISKATNLAASAVSIYLVANHPVAGRGTDCGVEGADSGGRATPEYRIDELRDHGRPARAALAHQRRTRRLGRRTVQELAVVGHGVARRQAALSRVGAGPVLAHPEYADHGGRDGRDLCPAVRHGGRALSAVSDHWARDLAIHLLRNQRGMLHVLILAADHPAGVHAFHHLRLADRIPQPARVAA